MSETNPSVNTREEFNASVRVLYRDGAPSLLEPTATLPAVGRTDTPVVATPNIIVVIKSYAATDEAALHTHPDEEHTFTSCTDLAPQLK